MAQKGPQTLPIEEPWIGRHRRSCGGCKILTCTSIHGPVAQSCLITGCYFCADLATIDDEISDAYDCLLKLVKKQAQIVKKTHRKPYIHRLPVEILSLIFIFVEKGYDDHVGKPSFGLPRYSPPLHVGSVSKKWKDITFQTPQLWMGISVNLTKPVDAQLKMINESARRSGALPLNLAIFSLQHLSIDHEQAALREWDGVAKALRSLVLHWNEVALQAPWSICYKLLDQFEECPSITSFCALIPGFDGNPIKLQHVEWDNLVHLELGFISQGEVLHIIWHAQKLRHFVIEWERVGENVYYPLPTTPVTNFSLIHFKTRDDIFDYLTLPSLRYLDCRTTENTHTIEYLDSVIRFLNRSQAPLRTFFFDCDIDTVDLAHSLEKLPLITSLTIRNLNQKKTQPHPTDPHQTLSQNHPSASSTISNHHTFHGSFVLVTLQSFVPKQYPIRYPWFGKHEGFCRPMFIA